jgi:hypothetical protein
MSQSRQPCVRAEMRMADEIDRGQVNGEISTGGRPSETVLTSDSLGIDRRRVAEWRETRDAGDAGMRIPQPGVANGQMETAPRLHEQ